MKWGNEIAVNGVRPDWIRSSDQIFCTQLGVAYPADILVWEDANPFRLPADHPYYTVQRYNEQHGTSFVYWPGGDAAPADWDGEPVLWRNGRVVSGDDDFCWGTEAFNHDPKSTQPRDLIGYTRRSEPARDTVAVERMSEREAIEAWDASVLHLSIRDAHIATLYSLGLIRPEPPTEAERIAAETGVSFETVQRVLSARQG